MSKQKYLSILMVVVLLCCVAFAKVDPKDYIDSYPTDSEAISAMLAEIQKKSPFISDSLDMWTQWGHVVFDIHRELYESADSNIDQLKAGYRNNPDLPKGLYWLGNAYWKTGQYTEATNMYQQVIDAYPDSVDAIHAAKNKTMLYIRQKDFINAQTSLNQLLSNYDGNPDKPMAVMFVGNAYWKEGSNDKAVEVFQNVINSWPDSKAALNSAKNLGILYVKQGDFVNAQDAVIQLKNNFTGSEDLPKALGRIANEYRLGGHIDEAKPIYEDVLSTWPNDYYAMFAERSLLAIDLKKGNYETVSNNIPAFISKYANHEEMSKALFWLLEEYYQEAARQEDKQRADALLLHALVLGELRENMFSGKKDSYSDPKFYVCLGDTYFKLGQYDKSIDVFNKYLTEYPENELACHGWFKIGRCYEKMIQEGVISEEQAVPNIKAAYTTVVNHYPNSKAVKAAQLWLNKN